MSCHHGKFFQPGFAPAGISRHRVIFKKVRSREAKNSPAPAFPLSPLGRDGGKTNIGKLHPETQNSLITSAKQERPISEELKGGGGGGGRMGNVWVNIPKDDQHQLTSKYYDRRRSTLNDTSDLDIPITINNSDGHRRTPDTRSALLMFSPVMPPLTRTIRVGS